ncbi:MAG: hypothetical protein P1U89_07955 [Verrucomicrobiales bacterium]|nr:hypothetical protein [Verrucomicrobiales bacterium]
MAALIDLNVGADIIMWLGWLMVALGLFKIVIYLIGELSPGVWEKIKSPTFRKLFTGQGNRLLFGLGGLFTVLFGLGSVGIAFLIRRLAGMV